MAILKIDHQIFNLKSGCHLIGSDENLKISINSKTIDGKHALLEISSYGMKIFDLQTKNGTFINGNKIDSVKSIELPKKCPIQFGSITGDLILHRENDSGYIEKPTHSEIIVSSPGENDETHTFFMNSRNRKKITSTPNNVVNNDVIVKNNIILKTENGHENIKEDKNNWNEKNSVNSNTSSFFVPETQIVMTNQNELNLSNSNCNNSSNGDNSSFCVPETQPSILVPQNKTNDIFLNIIDENIRKNVDNMCDDDEFYIPETQEIFNRTNKSLNINSQVGSLYKISTQEFNATAVGCDGKLESSSDLSNDSENLFNGLQLSANIPLIKYNGLQTNSTESIPVKTNDKMNNFNADCEYDDEYDAEMSALKWTETDRKNSCKAVSNSTTPDFLLEDNKILSVNEKLEYIREGSITPDFILENSNTIKNIENNSVLPDLKLDCEFDENKRKEEKLEDSFNQNESNEHLEPTQIFSKSIVQNVSNTSLQKSIFSQLIDDELQPTQMFIREIPVSNDLNKEKPINSNKSSVNNSDSTELFVAPTRKSNHKKSFVVENDISLEPTQPFIREKMAHVPEENSIINSNLTSQSDDKGSLTKRTVNNNNNKKRKNLSSSDEEEDLVPVNTFKTPKSSHIKKVNSNCSSNVSTVKRKNNNSISSNKSSDSNSEYHFDFITSTPQFDFIKPHQSIEIKQAAHLFNNVKSKNNKILLEESSDEDDIENLLSLLDEKKNDAKINKTSSNLKRNKSTKNKKLVNDKENNTKSGNIKSQDSRNAPIRKSTRKKTQPNYIQCYITDNFTEQYCGDLEKSSRKESTSRKRHHNKDNEIDDHEKIAKINNKASHEERKKSQKKLLGNGRSDSEDKNRDENDHLPSHDENCGVSTRRQNKAFKHKFVFTIVDASQYRSVIESIGGEIVDNPKDATILITNAILRTCKFMVALGRGIPIVSNKWLDAIMKTPSNFISYNNFIIKDPVNEKKFKFSLIKTLELSAKFSIFENYIFLITPKTTPPPSELIQIIGCTGGQYVKEIPKGTIDISKFYVVSDQKDNKLWPKIRKSIPNVNIISTEGILMSVMQHSIRFNSNLLCQKRL